VDVRGVVVMYMCSSDCESDKESVDGGGTRTVIYKTGMPHRSTTCEAYMRVLDSYGRRTNKIPIGTDPVKGNSRRMRMQQQQHKTREEHKREGETKRDRDRDRDRQQEREIVRERER
jgi:hypothetical protein